MTRTRQWCSATSEPVQLQAARAVLKDMSFRSWFLRSTDGRLHARVLVAGRPEVYAIRSAAFRAWLIDRYARTCQETPSDWAIRRVLARLEATARFDGGRPSILIRVGHDGNVNANGNGNGDGSAFYLDLADPSGQAVKIGPDGWSVVKFSRTTTTIARKRP